MILPDLTTVQPALLTIPPVREVEMEVVFGTPSKNCTGSGICMVASRLPAQQWIPCPHAPVVIHYDPGHELVFRFRKQRLPEIVVQDYFSSKEFLVEEPFSLPVRLIRMWGLQQTHIPAGYYQLEEYCQEWRLYFPLITAYVSNIKT